MIGSTARKMALALALFLLVAFVAFLVNQTAQIVQLAGAAHPVAGQAVFWGLIFLYAACLGVPIALFLRLPKPLKPPESEGSPEFEAHLERLRKRLSSNPHLAGRSLASRAGIEAGLVTLNERADRVIQATASQVFITTAISQNGSLDVLLVLAAQSKLVWRVAHVYYQRPTFRDLAYLYANVATTAFIAGELEDLDLATQLQPVLASALGSAAGAVPGLQTASAVLMNSVMTGAANAFLTLRVGIIARNYSSALVLPKKGEVRRSAIATATAMLGSIALEGTRKVSAAFWKASSRGVTGAITGVGDQVRRTGTSIAEKIGLRKRGESEPLEG